MSSSFDKIDYSLRPAKHAERRMLAEVFSRLRPFEPVEDYHYVGLGSVWFSDFIVFHRSLGIRKMLSIEREAQSQKRIEANKPFRSIEMRYKPSSQVLPTLNWADRHFIWLDYDDPLTTDMLRDARIVAANGRSGTVLAVSMQCQRAPEDIDAERENNGQTGLQRFTNTFGRERVSDETMADDLSGWRFGQLSRNLVYGEIEDALAKRNAALPAQEQLRFRKICEFEYADGAKMTTLVGILVSAAEMNAFTECRFSTLDFLPSQGRLVKIKVPILTLRELRHIERQLPKKLDEDWDLGSIPLAQANKYAAFYRYFPNFVHAEP